MSNITSTSAQVASVRTPIRRLKNEESYRTQDIVIVEEPMEIQLAQLKDGQQIETTISVTMRTPGHDFELALGYLVGEAVIQRQRDVTNVRHCGPPSPDKGYQNVTQVHLNDDIEFDFSRLERNFYTTSSCGVCGKTSIDAVSVPLAEQHTSRMTIRDSVLQNLPSKLRAWQTEFKRTGGLHAAATFDSSGAIQRVREDVGRHNALDKLIGSYFYESGTPLQSLGLMLSGRASFELVQKAAVVGIPTIVAIGPPSNLAIELAEERHITLIGFLRESGFNTYTNLDHA